MFMDENNGFRSKVNFQLSFTHKVCSSYDPASTTDPVCFSLFTPNPTPNTTPTPTPTPTPAPTPTLGPFPLPPPAQPWPPPQDQWRDPLAASLVFTAVCLHRVTLPLH